MFCAIERTGLLVLDALKDVTAAGALLQVFSRVYCSILLIE